MVLFDHQRRDGRLPDSVSDRLVRWEFAKPPIHGWALGKLMVHPGLLSDEQLQEAYEPLCRWTRWWLDCRDDDRDGLPQYNHGNDSGWDNGTTFLGGVPVETPDLAAFLVLQMETLATVARRLGKADEANGWDRESSALLTRLLDRLWRKDRFVALRGESHATVDTDSLLPLVPLVLGRRLPPSVSSALVRRLRERFLTPHGLATEWPESQEYRSDGYWRGPIWAPSTYLMVDGLIDLGERGLAQEISRGFLAMASRSGMAECFDALTGQGLRDRAYTWTASVFLLLQNAFAERG
jgi:glycogen debranching enzyme